MRTIIRDNYDPQLGDYHERIIIDEARERRWLFDCDGVFMPFNETKVVNERGDSEIYAVSQKLFTDTVVEIEGDVDDLEKGLADEIDARKAADNVLQGEIDDIKNAPDVVDIVATYAALQAYDTSKLTDKDIIRVLADETHDGQSTYYRWTASSSTWAYIGAVGDYYTKSQTDALLADKLDNNTTFWGRTAANGAVSGTIDFGDGATIGTHEGAGSNINLLLSRTDGTYTSAIDVGSRSIYIGTQDTSIIAFDTASGGVISAGGAKINGVGSPTSNSDAANKAYVDSGLGTKQDTLTAGTNVQISNENVISATDTTYTAGTNISINADNEISATDTTYTAGNGLDLTDTEFSVDSTVVALQTDLPTQTSDLTNDGADGTSTYVETDELATVATTGNYSDLLNTPTIPTVNDATLTIQKNSTDVGTFTANASSNSTINITVPTTAADVSALPDSTKYGASISLTIDSSTYVVTAQLKDQDNNNLGSAQTIDLPLESVVVNGSYDSQTKKIILTLQNGNTIEFSVADLVSGLQSEITSQSPLDADLVDDSTSTNKFVTSTDITAWNGKQDALTAGSNISISGSTISATDTTYSVFTGADSSTAGTSGLVPAPAAGDETKFLSGNGLWTTVSQYSLPIASANDLGGVKVGTNLSIDSVTGVLSATDTTYSAFTGTDGTAAGVSGLVPAPATTDAGKFLNADGTWGEVKTHKFFYMDVDLLGRLSVNDSFNLYTDLELTQVATTREIIEACLTGDAYIVAHADISPAFSSPIYLITEDGYPESSPYYLTWADYWIDAGERYAIPVYYNAWADNINSQSLTFGGRTGQYTNYVSTIIKRNAGAPTTSTVGTVGQLLEDTTNGKLYICTAIGPGNPPSYYTWEKVNTNVEAISSTDWSNLWQ